MNQPKNIRTLDSFGLVTGHTINTTPQDKTNILEVGIVLDIIMDENHPLFKNNVQTTRIDVEHWPVNVQNKKVDVNDPDLSWIGRALVRPLYSQKLTDKDNLVWAYPLESNISEYPLINELVVLEKHNGQLYYTKKLNYQNWTNNNLDFATQVAISGKFNTEMFSNQPYQGTSSLTNYNGSVGYKGVAGKYFTANNRIRSIKRFEGDLAIESRFGQSIHLTAYDDNRKNDIGDPKNLDYKNGGNPMILIRNRQRPILAEGNSLSLQNSPNQAKIYGTSQEKNVGGYIEEDINHDGSSIHITTGLTISNWKPTCFTQMFGLNTGESSETTFTYPILNGDQIVINSDRLIFSSRYGETFHHSKKRYSVFTDSEFTVNAYDQIVLTSQNKTVINSPAIYLGEYDATGEPALLGQTTINWLYQMCNWMLSHYHIHQHSHTNAGEPSPKTTQTVIDPQALQLMALRDSLQTLLSKRVFITGGGFAPGQDGINIKNGNKALSINTANGNNVPGGYMGSNYRTP